MIGLHKKCALVAASTLLVFVLLVGLNSLAQGQPTAPTLATPENEALTNDNTPYFSWENLTGQNILYYRLVVDNSPDFADGDNFYDNIVLTDNFDNFDTHPENALPDGTWYWHVRGENTTGGIGAWSQTWTSTVDATPPTVQISVSTSLVFDNYVGSDNFVVTATFNENMDNTITPTIAFTPDVTLDTLENVENAWTVDNSVCTWTYDVDDEGVENLGVDVRISGGKDLAGNDQVDNTGENMFSVDTLAPVAPTLVSPENNENTNDNTPNLDWSTVSDASLPVLYRVHVSDNSQFPYDNVDSGWISDDNYITSELAESMWYWRVHAKDNAGNVGDNSASRSFRVDITAPVAPTLVSPDNGAQTADSTPTLSWNVVNDNSLPVTYDLQVDDDSDFSAPTENVSGLTDYSYATSSLADGTWYWYVRARDNVGNVGSWSSSRLFTVDTAAQAAPVLTAPANGAFTNNSTPTFDWEPVSGAASYTLQYATDSGFTQNLTTGSSTASDYTPTTTLADGTWYWRVRTVDAVGNASDWSSAWSFTIDTATPTVTISPSLGATPTATGWTLNTINTSIEISGSVTDATSVTVKIDDVKVNVVDRSFRKTVNLMVIGTNTFTIAVTDAAGNTTTRTLKVIRAGVEPPPVTEPAISSEQAVFIAALAVLAIVVMVFVKTVFVKKPAEPSQVPAPSLEFERGVRGLFHLQKPI